MEYRAFRAESVAADDSGKLVFLVTPFGRETTIGDMKRGGFREEVGKGCFTKTLKEGDPLMVYQHDLTRPLARASAGNLTLSEGELDGSEGLVGEAKPADTSYARDLRALVDAKVVTGMSFGFNVIKDEWRNEDGSPADRLTGTHRILREVQLIEVSPVTRPAYGGTAISARDEASALLEERRQAAERSEPDTETEAEERGPKPYGNVPYADEKNGKYPIDAAHVKAAWAYINQAKNAAKYPLNGVTLASVKAKIRAAMKKFGHSTASSEKNSFEFYNAEWRDDDPFLDDFYEIDADDEADEGEASESKAAPLDLETESALVAALLAHRSDPAITDAIDYCIARREDEKREAEQQRDDPDGQEYQAIDKAIRHLMEKPADVKGALAVLRENQMSRRGSQEPEASTPDAEDETLALQMQMRSREIELDII